MAGWLQEEGTLVLNICVIIMRATLSYDHVLIIDEPQ